MELEPKPLSDRVPGLAFRGCGLLGFAVGFTIGLDRMSEGLRCAFDGGCEAGASDPGIEKLLVPAGLGLLAGLMLGWLLYSWLTRRA